MGHISRKLCILLLMFLTGFTSLCLTSNSSINHLLRLCEQFSILFHVTLDEVLSINPSLMFFSLETLTSISTGLPILVQLISLVNSVVFFQTQMTFLRWLTFLFGSQTVILIVLLFWVYSFLLALVFVLQWLSLHWEILIMLLSQFPLTFYQIHNGMSRFIA